MKKLLIMIAVLVLSGYYCKATAPTDYFRSVQNGDWGSLSTWESSPDNITWTAATLIPTSAANTISIRSPYTVSVSSNQDMDQVMIESGGGLLHSGGTVTVNDGAGDDIIVQTGGIFTLTSNSNGPVFIPASATVIINSGGMLRLSASGLTGPGSGVNANNYIYQDASILEYTLNLAFSSAGVTYFPNANAATIPIFRTTGNLGLIGSNSNTIINGVFECNGTITFDNTGNKIFRNGISGTGNINATAASGKFIISGATAKLGGPGLLTLPTLGLTISNNVNLTMTSNKTVIGDCYLLTNVLVTTGVYNLIIAGNLSSVVPSHVVTNNTGKLIINNINSATVTFPVGATAADYNPLSISNGGGLNYGVRVENGINPAIAVPVNAVNRTWYITPTGGTPGTVNTNFFYSAGHGNAGFNYAANLELGQHTGVWNVIQTGIVPSGSYQVATAISTLGNSIESPLVLGNLGAILSVDDPVTIEYFKGVKQNAAHSLQWKLTCNSGKVVTMVLEKSNNGINYEAVFSAQATDIQCRQPFNFIDNKPTAGTNYYRLKLTDINGNISYSTVVQLINTIKGIELLDIAPNPVVNNFFNLQVRSEHAQNLQLVITDIQGRLVHASVVNIVAGLNRIPVQTTGLTAGSYQLFGETRKGKTGMLRLVVQ